MPRIFLLFLLFTNTLASAQPISNQVHRVLFLGNSITYEGTYVSAVEAYLIVHRSELDIEFMNLGLPSETVSGLSEEGHAGGKFPRPDLHERLRRVLAQTKPDLVFACYGMNDGIVMPFDEGRFQKYKDGIQWLHDTLASVCQRVILLTPPIYDELRAQRNGYGKVLDIYADWLLKQGKKAGWEIVDLHFPMKKYLEAHRKVDEKFSLDGFALASDGVHPAEVGHWIMAKQILLHLGETSVARQPTIKQAMADVPNGEQIWKLVSQRQAMMKDAWLTATKHLRPGMKTGLPLDEAKSKAAEIAVQIKALKP